MSTPQPKRSLNHIKPYVAGKSAIQNYDGPLIKLSSNESPYGPSPKALEAYHAAAENLALYPDGSAQELRETIATVHNLDASQILCGAGSDEILNFIAQAYLETGDTGIYTEHGFLVYKLAILGAGGEPVVVPETNLKTDTDAIVSAITPKTKVIFIANPNNPTGTFLTPDEITALHARIPPSVLLVVDEAYAECASAADYSTMLSLAAHSENVLITRTLSKLYSLASLRVGWCFGHPNIIEALNKVRGPFNMTHPSLKAATAAITDQAFLKDAAEKNVNERARMDKELKALGLTVTPSQGNFVLVHFNKTGEITAPKVDAALQAKGLIVRRVDNYGLPHALRISIGTHSQNTACLDALTAYITDNT